MAFLVEFLKQVGHCCCQSLATQGASFHGGLYRAIRSYNDDAGTHSQVARRRGLGRSLALHEETDAENEVCFHTCLVTWVAFMKPPIPWQNQPRRRASEAAIFDRSVPGLNNF